VAAGAGPPAWAKVAAGLAAGLLLGAGLLILFAFNPSQTRIFPPCPLHWATGLYCPGCGSLRAMHCLLHGHVAAAFRLNPLLLVTLPVLGALTLRRAWALKPWLPWAVVVVLLAYGVARNIPAWPLTLLAPH
jgi:hypothetical protein